MKMGEVVVSSEGGMDIDLETEKDGSSEVVRTRWESFLPRMVLRVLLVEADDSTRQIISALLRKCGYRVAAVPDGLAAWETLKCRPHSIDLVLTEVELPSISGFALLTLVMEHDVCKNIPVIMMSLHDSISMVLKCMLKGAADFLIKPVRRNELRNLWQHVWRRHSLLGGHVPQNLHDVYHKGGAISENNMASSHSSDYAASSQKNKGSEKVSDAQGLSQLKCRSASNTCSTDMERQNECAKLETESLMPESKTGGSTIGASDELIVSEKLNRSGSEVAQCDDALRLEEDYGCVKTMPQGEGEGPKNDRINADITYGIHGCNDELIEPSSGAIDLIGTFDNHQEVPDKLSTPNDGIPDKLSTLHNRTKKCEFSPHLELSLRKSFPSTSNDQGNDERHTLNHSAASAFSWYNNSKACPTPTSNSAELKDGSSKSDEILSNQLSENATGGFQPCCATSSNSRENMTSLVMGQSEQAAVAFAGPHLGFIPVPGVRFDNIFAGYSHIFPSIFYTKSGLQPAWSPNSSHQKEHHPFPISASVHSNPDVHDSEQVYGRTGEIKHNSVDQTVCEQSKGRPLEQLRHGSPAGNQSSNSGLCNGLANNSSSGTYSRIDRNSSSAKASGTGTVPQNLNGCTLFIHDGFNGISARHSSQRDAALTKFRLKRKDRCYDKKKNQFCSHVKVKSDARISRCLKECNMWLTSVRTVGCDEARANKDEASMKRKTQPPIFFMQRTYPNVGAGECIGSTDLSVAVTDLY
ncbi:Two-component response regulator-like PRR95 [Citrus sinensis]|uniref:Two-component response regulator-like PRR95 n=1 Tax=Citrus sinensis TaxID=2711 RepID=A0ACB8MNK6_CITSI|nr:Two-component response regulator-like PRR95 [Citrus sinensis]